jgi:hypothetical protein
MADERKKEQGEQFEVLVRPLMKWLAENRHPHTTVVITAMNAELLEGQIAISTDEYLVD